MKCMNMANFLKKYLPFIKSYLFFMLILLYLPAAFAQDQTVPPANPPPPLPQVSTTTQPADVNQAQQAPPSTNAKSAYPPGFFSTQTETTAQPAATYPPSITTQTTTTKTDQTYPPGFATNTTTDQTYPPGFTAGEHKAMPTPRHHRRRRNAPLTYEEGQKLMLNTVPTNSPQPSQDSMFAFNMLLQQNMPLTPQQVVLLRQQIDMSQRAASIPPNIPPKPVSTTIMVNLAPGTTPPVIRLAQGYVSSLVFVDSTGAPWPIAAFDIGNPKAVNLQWDGRSNILLLQGVQPYSDGNIVIRLVGLPTPITLEIVSGQRVVDYRVDLHVSGLGPNTKEIPLGTPLPNSADTLLLDVLNGVAPAGSRLLIVKGADSQAFLLADKMYLRTRLTVLSPGWVATMSSADGMHAYELPKTSSVLVSRYGEPVELKIEGF